MDLRQNNGLAAQRGHRPQTAEIALAPHPVPGKTLHTILRISSASKHGFQADGVKTDHDLIADHDCGGGAAVIFSDQLKHRLLIGADILHLKLDSPLREEGFRRVTWWSTRLAVNDNFLL